MQNKQQLIVLQQQFTTPNKSVGEEVREGSMLVVRA